MTAAILGYNRREWLGMVPKKERSSFVVTVDCGADGCSIGERFTFKGVLPPDQVAKNVERKGWLLRKGKGPLCPTHSAVSRHKERAVEPELALNIAVSPAAQESPVANNIPKLRMVDIAVLSTALNAGFFVITPEVASAVLAERHRRNRNLRPMKLAQLTGDIHTGSFALNGESIIFDTDGMLLDGQHRMKACADTGVAIMSLVAFGITPGAMGTVDQGSARTVGDALSIDGIVNGNEMAATARMVASFEQNDHRSFAGSSSISRATVAETIMIYPGIADSVSYARRNSPNLVGIAPASAVAMCHFVLCQRYGREQVENYLDRVAIGDDIRQGDPAFVVRKRLMGAGRKTAQFTVEVILRGWLSQLRGKSISNLPTSGEFPTLISEKHRAGALKGNAAKRGE